MTIVKPFKSLRPAKELASQIAALPYDVYNRSEAKEVVANNPLSFLQIDRGETLLDDSVSTYDDIVYETAANKLKEMIGKGEFTYDDEEAYYIYELERLGQIQRGIVGCVLAKEYDAGIIKKHENTREVKENDRINHIQKLRAHTGPIFLTYKNSESIQKVVNSVIENSEVIFEFTGEDEVRHKGYMVSKARDIIALRDITEAMEALYIADGHHRAASAAKVARINNYEGETGEFLAVMFPDDELHILDYNRVVTDLNNLSVESFLEAVSQYFDVTKMGGEPFSPVNKASYGMYIDETWYKLEFKDLSLISEDPVATLDVTILQDYILHPILGIEDSRNSDRIDFVGGIRGLVELEKRVAGDMVVAFSMKATSISELINVSDAGLLMPPKSTWFEPKLRSGLFIHTF